MTQTYLQPDEGIKCICDDCGEETMSEDLAPVTDLEERVSPGYLCPAGQCKCGSLAYYADDAAPRYTAQRELVRLRELLSNVVASSEANDHGSLMNAIEAAKAGPNG